MLFRRESPPKLGSEPGVLEGVFMAVVCFRGLRTSQFEIFNVYAAPSSILSRPLSSSPPQTRPLRNPVSGGRHSFHPSAHARCGGHPHTPGRGATRLCAPQYSKPVHGSTGSRRTSLRLCKGLADGGKDRKGEEAGASSSMTIIRHCILKDPKALGKGQVSVVTERGCHKLPRARLRWRTPPADGRERLPVSSWPPPPPRLPPSPPPSGPCVASHGKRH